jgi:hypothetical protein
MNNRSLLQALAIGALVLAAAAAIAIGAYNAGVAHGMAESARAVAAPPAGIPVYPYAWGRPWGAGFFPVFPIFFFLFLFVVLRGLVWRRHWHGGWGGGYGYHGVPPAFEEWHRRAHAEQPPTPASGGTT